jgi:hypothetical protein
LMFRRDLVSAGPMVQREIDLPHTKAKSDALAVYLWCTVRSSRMNPQMTSKVKPRVPTVPPTVHTR